MNPLHEDNDLVRERVKKLKALQALGIDPYGGKFPKSLYIKELVAGFEDHKPAQSAGRLTALRFMGKSAFGDLRDESGRIQVYVKREELPELEAKIFDLLDLGDTLGVEGFLFKTKTGEISIHVQKLSLLSKALRPLPEKWHGLKDVEERHRRRYLDLAANEESREVFRQRSLVVRSIRRTLDDKGYLEVETPMMHPIPGGAAGKPFQTHHEALGLDLYLRVAPELYLKKLLVGGFDRVYEINKSFRNEGISTRHNPEFTMLEVYTAYHDVNDVMDLCEELIKKAAMDLFGKLQNGDLDLSQWKRVSFAGLMKDKFGILPDDSTEAWIQKLKKHGINVEGKDLSRTQIINIVGDLLDEAIGDHNLAGRGRDRAVQGPIFVTEYFAELSPLARKNKKNPHLADRFELYIGGMEIANGYSEQNDPVEQRRRFMEELNPIGDGHARPLPGQDLEKRLDEDFLCALEHGMPPAGGLGIGIDRLVMLLANRQSIREVILFPQMRKEV